MKRITFSERVLPSAGFYVAALLLPLGLWVVFLPMNLVLGLALGPISYLMVVLATVFWSPKIEVSDHNLRVGRATIELENVGEVKSVPIADAFKAKSIGLDARAFTQFQIGVKGLVRIEIADQRDPTPYWLVSVRDTAGLVGALDANRAKL